MWKGLVCMLYLAITDVSRRARRRRSPPTAAPVINELARQTVVSLLRSFRTYLSSEASR